MQVGIFGFFAHLNFHFSASPCVFTPLRAFSNFSYDEIKNNFMLYVFILLSVKSFEVKGFQFKLIMIYFLPEQYKYGACHKCIHAKIC